MGNNKTSVTNLTIGGAISVIVMAIVGKFVVFDPTVSSSIVVALTAIINYIIPVKKG